MWESQKQGGPLRWASRLLRIGGHLDYDAWSDGSHQDIEQLVRRTCKSADDGVGGSLEEFLAARERLLQEYLGGLPVEGKDWSSAKSVGKESQPDSSLVDTFRHMPQEGGSTHFRSYSMPMDDLVSPYVSQDSTSTARSKRVLLIEPGISSRKLGIGIEPQNFQSNESDELSPFLTPGTTYRKPSRSFRSRMQKAFRRTGDGLGGHVDNSLSPLLADG